ncbi:DUF4391 domain-containing protein [Microbacterium sp. zg-YB36]|uniref:DUF4391 domain-containing protein n=1 Tax=Microbacterium sp. zg-YB36 TaxID=2969407 RepID=UPI00214B5E8C|nr:DUF4391 domain-containing protein [Microbacterium sp. zg-YB36]MDL5350948.1 DUF4391 domain-containing protein [Microbacterium sp. zg-YB36]
MTDVLYEWPAGARFGAHIPKARFYERTAARSALREKFVSEVSRISWTYKLAVETINLPGSREVPEIEVLQLDAKANDIGTQVLASIDKAIPNPVIFEIHRENGDGRAVRMAAAHKPAGSSTPAPSAYFSTAWMRGDTPRTPLPVAITMPALYAVLIGRLTSIAVRPGENPSEVGGRLNAVRRLEREISTIERALRSEPQLNRKIGLRRELKAKQAELDQTR